MENDPLATRPRRPGWRAWAIGCTSLAALALAVLPANPAEAASTQDQSNAGSSAILWTPGAALYFGQTFTPSMTGYLTRVDVKVLWSQADSTPTYLRVYDTISNNFGIVPNGAPLSSQLVSGMPIDTGGQCNSASMSSFTLASPVYVQAGHAYSFTLEHPAFSDPNYLMACFTGSTYSGGPALAYDWNDHQVAGWDWLQYPSNDLFFSTYVNPTAATGMPPMFQGVPMPTSGQCSDVNDSGLDYGTGLHGHWHRAWQGWVKSADPVVQGGWACARTLVHDGQGWTVQ